MTSTISKFFKRRRDGDLNENEDLQPTIISNSVEEDDDRQVTLLVIGAGNRGNIYSQYSKDFPNRLKIVGIAEPRETRRSMFQLRYKVKTENTFVDWKDAAAKEKFADAVLISTLDDMHHAPCVAFADLGYHILCEKPMAPTEKECEEMVEACSRNNVMLVIGHVLRYSNGYMAVKKILLDGTIGEVIGIQHLEPVGWWHFAHSYVRGNWNKEVKDIGSLMTKSCHDLDLIKHFLGDKKCKKIQSFGSLTHFNTANKPPEASDRCLDCKIEKSCPYSAVRQYLEPVQRGFPNWVSYVVSDIPDIENITNALQTGPYGKCVYISDNEVCDYQTVNMEFENGKYATFVMSAFTKDVCKRKIQIFGTKGQIECDGSEVKLFDFLTEKHSVIRGDSPMEITCLSGHGYSDYYLMKAFVKSVATNNSDSIHSGPEDSLRGHRLVLAAEKSRKLGGVMLNINI